MSTSTKTWSKNLFKKKAFSRSSDQSHLNVEGILSIFSFGTKPTSHRTTPNFKSFRTARPKNRRLWNLNCTVATLYILSTLNPAVVSPLTIEARSATAFKKHTSECTTATMRMNSYPQTSYLSLNCHLTQWMNLVKRSAGARMQRAAK